MRLIITGILLSLLGACGADHTPATETAAERFVALESAGMSARDRAPEGCVQDVHTGLIWELKSDDTGLHDWRNTYSWYDPDEAQDDFDHRGTPDGGACSGSGCDTHDLVMVANEEGVCGFTDWRIPLRDELFSISDLARADNPPTVDTRFFPLTQEGEYWTSNDYSFQPGSAWAWHFKFGHDRVDWKKTPKFVRLVRGSASGLTAVKE
ncbi:MAG: DUF1566 domain-containing protein [Woeseiaceae bacterium]